jgi:acetyltransferase-like isoleucine patch superfamily enzyme
MLTRIFRHVYRRISPIGYARHIGVQVGDGCRLINVSFSTEPYMIKIGDHVSATATRFETHDGGVWVLRDELPELDVIRAIEIGSNVFIGYGTIILPGSIVGDDVVIGAGSVVTGEIPSGSVAAGVPARVIKDIESYRLSSLERGVNTKAMTQSEKRDFMTARGRLWPSK